MDTQPQSTPERIAASITCVVDSLGNSIPNPGTTQDTVLTLSGSGTADSVIFIYDSDLFLTTASVTINGTWSFGPETVVLGRHAFTVRDEWDGVDSPEWVVTVSVVAVGPEITTIMDAAGNEIPDQGTTDDNSSITVLGTAAPNQQVELFDDPAFIGTLPVDANGSWRFQASNVGLKTYRIFAKGLYGSHPESAVWIFTVRELASGTEDFESLTQHVYLYYQVRVPLPSGLSAISTTTLDNPQDLWAYLSYQPTATPGQKGTLMVGCTTTYGNTVELEFGGLIRRLRFSYYFYQLSPVNAVMRFWDESGRLIDTYPLNVGDHQPVEVTFDRPCLKGEIYAGNVPGSGSSRSSIRFESFQWS